MTTDQRSIATPGARYTTVAIILHWLIAALLIFEVGLGLRMADAHGSAKFVVFQLHKSIGITILLLVALRLVWRFYRTPPPVGATGWEKALAHLVHVMFYLLLFAMPISGWIIVSTSRIVVPTLLYGVIPWPHFPGLAGLAEGAKAGWNGAADFVHTNLVYVIYAAFALHLAGALKHQLLDHDGDVARMAPGVRARRWNDPRLAAILLGVVGMAGLGLAWLPIGHAEPATTATARGATTTGTAPTVAAPPAITTAEVQNASEPAADDDAPANTSAPAPAAAALASWRIDKGSTLRFTSSWSGDAIGGGFTSFAGDIVFSPDQLDASHVEIRVNTATAFSGDAQRDETLKSSDWFSVASFATATFEANRFRKTGADRYVATGTLALKGATLPITLPFRLKITGDKAVMQGTATIDRIAYKIGEGEYAEPTEIPAAVKVDATINATKK